jgi:siroheme synthase
VESATRPEERHTVGTLGALAELLSGRPPAGPLVVLIGEVTSLAVGASPPGPLLRDVSHIVSITYFAARAAKLDSLIFKTIDRRDPELI